MGHWHSGLHVQPHKHPAPTPLGGIIKNRGTNLITLHRPKQQSPTGVVEHTYPHRKQPQTSIEPQTTIETQNNTQTKHQKSIKTP
jgi:hypothetical protein